jgi:hypothetical protein
MPINYQLGKVYKITSYSGDKVYIGSTALPRLCTRFQSHVQDYKKWQRDNTRGKIRSFELFNEYGYDNCQITLLENVPANNKDELRIRERYYIESIECINKCIPCRTKQECKEYQKEYHEKNKEVLSEYQKEYQEKNKDAIREHKNTKCVCNICGGKYTTTHKSCHLKSKKHLNAVAAVVPDLLLSNSISDQPPV